MIKTKPPAKKDFADSFGKILIGWNMAYRKSIAKPNKRRRSEEGGEQLLQMFLC